MSMDEIKNFLKSDVLILGTERTIKALRNNELEKVFLASNSSAELKEDVNTYAPIAGAEVEMLPVPNDELGTVCKKPFSISCIGLKKANQEKKY